MKTSSPIGAWKCNFQTFLEIMTDRPNDQPTDRQTNMTGRTEVTLQKQKSSNNRYLHNANFLTSDLDRIIKATK